MGAVLFCTALAIYFFIHSFQWYIIAVVTIKDNLYLLLFIKIKDNNMSADNKPYIYVFTSLLNQGSPTKSFLHIKSLDT